MLRPTSFWTDGSTFDVVPAGLDSDGDNVSAAADCDDTNGTLWQAVELDYDNDLDGVGGDLTPGGITCMGTITSGYAYAGDDCDDSVNSLGDIASDADCDGALTIDDCDDFDATLGDMANDADCDGALTIDDCDDADYTLGDMANDFDCDGFLTWNTATT
jgi:hypothetical protein